MDKITIFSRLKIEQCLLVGSTTLPAFRTWYLVIVVGVGPIGVFAAIKLDYAGDNFLVAEKGGGIIKGYIIPTLV